MKKILSVLLIVFLMLTAAACSKSDNNETSNNSEGSNNSQPVKSVLDMIGSGDYKAAKELYDEKIDGNANLEYELNNAIAEKIDALISAYNEGTGTYDKANMYLNSLSKTEIFDRSDVNDYADTLSELKTSKEAYDKAASLSADGKLKEAYYEYLSVIPNDSNYSEATEKAQECIEKYKNDGIAEIESLIAAEKFNDAESKIEELYADFPDDSEIIDLAYKCADAEEAAKTKSRIESLTKDCEDAKSAVASLVEAEDYAAALDKLFISLDSIIANKKYKDYINFEKFYLDDDGEFVADELNEETMIYYDLYCFAENQMTDYEIKAVADAEKAFGSNHDYAAAMKIINLYMSYTGKFTKEMEEIFGDGRFIWLPEDTTTQAVEYYESFVPVKLSWLNPDSKSRYLCIGVAGNDWKSKVTTDILEKHTYEPFEIFCHEYNCYNNIFENTDYTNHTALDCTYFINGKYSTLTGTLFVPYVAHLDDWTSTNPSFTVYGDDIEIYKYNGFSKNNYTPVDFTIDITGVRYLRIELFGNQQIDNMVAPKICATDLVVAK